MSSSGRFITFEGIEGVGKSTQVSRLSAWLGEQQINHVVTREPGGTPLAEKIRDLVLVAREESMPANAELLLMFAARSVHLENWVLPNLRAHRWVVCDRFTDATYAYQGGGRQLPTTTIAQLESLVQQGLKPDLTLLLDAPVSVALSRARSRNGDAAQDRFERERHEFFERVQMAYHARARAEPARFALIDATQTVDRVATDIIERIRERSWIS